MHTINKIIVWITIFAHQFSHRVRGRLIYAGIRIGLPLVDVIGRCGMIRIEDDIHAFLSALFNINIKTSSLDATVREKKWLKEGLSILAEHL